jgi:hypothetical protein
MGCRQSTTNSTPHPPEDELSTHAGSGAVFGAPLHPHSSTGVHLGVPLVSRPVIGMTVEEYWS